MLCSNSVFAIFGWKQPPFVLTHDRSTKRQMKPYQVFVVIIGSWNMALVTKSKRTLLGAETFCSEDQSPRSDVITMYSGQDLREIDCGAAHKQQVLDEWTPFMVRHILGADVSSGCKAHMIWKWYKTSLRLHGDKWTPETLKRDPVPCSEFHMLPNVMLLSMDRFQECFCKNYLRHMCDERQIGEAIQGDDAQWMGQLLWTIGNDKGVSQMCLRMSQMPSAFTVLTVLVQHSNDFVAALHIVLYYYDPVIVGTASSIHQKLCSLECPEGGHCNFPGKWADMFQAQQDSSGSFYSMTFWSHMHPCQVVPQHYTVSVRKSNNEQADTVYETLLALTEELGTVTSDKLQLLQGKYCDLLPYIWFLQSDGLLDMSLSVQDSADQSMQQEMRIKSFVCWCMTQMKGVFFAAWDWGKNHFPDDQALGNLMHHWMRQGTLKKYVTESTDANVELSLHGYLLLLAPKDIPSMAWCIGMVQCFKRDVVRMGPTRFEC